MHVIRLLVASFRSYFAIFGVLSSIAVFHPLGAFFRFTPSDVNRDHRLGSYLPAKGDEVIRVNLVEVVAVGIWLGLDLSCGLQRTSLIDRKQSVFPTIFTGEISSWPTQQSRADGFEVGHHIAPHPVEIILRHH